MAHELTRPPSRLASQTRRQNVAAHATRHLRAAVRGARRAAVLLSGLPHRQPGAGRGPALGNLRAGAALAPALRSPAGLERRWLYTIALNLLRDHARRQTHEERVLRHVSAGACRGVRRRAGSGRAPRRALPGARDAQRRRARGARPALRRRPEAARRGAACSARARARSRAGSTEHYASCAPSSTEPYGRFHAAAADRQGVPAPDGLRAGRSPRSSGRR